MDKSLQVYLNEIIEQKDPESQEIYGSCVGDVIQVDSLGEVLIDFPGNISGPIVARLALTDNEISKLKKRNYTDKVLLVFENNNPQLPIIAGLVSNRLDSTIEYKNEVDKGFGEILIDGKEVGLHAKEEIVFRCGRSSITLKKDGKIIIRGVDLISRASRSNRIKGTTVKIN